MTISVGDSPTFYAWLFQFRGAIQIYGPDHMVQQYQEMIEDQSASLRALAVLKNRANR